MDHISEKDVRIFYPATIGHRFLVPTQASHQTVQVTLAQHDLIRRLAQQGDQGAGSHHWRICKDLVCTIGKEGILNGESKETHFS